LLASFAMAGLAAPATACSYSRPVVAAHPIATHQSHLAEVRVRVEQTLILPRLVAVRATVLGDSALFWRGNRIVIVLPGDDTASCYHGGLADPETIATDGSLQGYVALKAKADSPGVFSAWLASEQDRFRYAEFAQGKVNGEWRRARFRVPQ
jgi:hypothetical protein